MTTRKQSAGSGEKSAKKSAVTAPGSAPGVPFSSGKDPRRGRGPKKGAPNAGRPKIKFVEFCQRTIDDKKVKAAVRKILTNPDHPSFGTLYRTVGERAHGRPGSIDISIPIRPGDLTKEQLQRIAAGENEMVVLATTKAEPPPAAPKAPKRAAEPVSSAPIPALNAPPPAASAPPAPAGGPWPPPPPEDSPA